MLSLKPEEQYFKFACTVRTDGRIAIPKHLRTLYGILGGETAIVTLKVVK